MPLLRLLRVPNLLMVALVQSLLYRFHLLPALNAAGLSPRLSLSEFNMLVLATLCITAGGYIINDVYDYNMDLLNRGDRVVVYNKIALPTCIWIYILTGFTGFFLSLYLAFRVGQVLLSSLYIFSFVLLFLYTYDFKKRPLLGNLVVALFCAGVALLIGLAEWPALQLLAQEAPVVAQRLFARLEWYAVFALLSTLFRELIKDLEDQEGDRAAGCRTFPIVAGVAKSKILAAAIALSLIALIIGMYSLQVSGFGTWFYPGALIGVVVPLLYALYRLPQASTPRHFHHLSQLAKAVMLAGVLLLLA